MGWTFKSALKGGLTYRFAGIGKKVPRMLKSFFP
jgi:hypothetical protein